MGLNLIPPCAAQPRVRTSTRGLEGSPSRNRRSQILDRSHPGCRRSSSAPFLGCRPYFPLRQKADCHRTRPHASPVITALVKGDRDDVKEKRLHNFRVVYDFDSWAAHRSTKRYLRHFTSLFMSRIVAGLRVPLLLIALESSFVCAWEGALSAGLLPAGYRSIQVKAPVLFNLSSFALSLLLVFRTNNSYARFDEGRRLWGAMVNGCRDIMRQCLCFFGPEEPGLLELLTRWMAAIPWVMKDHVREEDTLKEDLQRYLRPNEIEAVLASEHKPLFALHVVTEICSRAPISEKERLQLDARVNELLVMMGGCERIIKTPIPVSYTRHTARFLVIWLALLPFSIYQQCGWVTIFSCIVLGFCLLAIEEIAVTIEEPFNILPLEAINTTISGNVQALARQLGGVVDLVDNTTGTVRNRPAAGNFPSD